jgi:hypothetical protein
MEGRCKFLSHQRHYGVIENEAGSWIFFCSDVIGAPICTSDVCTFELVDNPRRVGELKAANIRVRAVDSAPKTKAAPNTVFVANLPYLLLEEDIRNLFGEFGEVKQIRLIWNAATGQSRGFGFVEMADGTSMARVIGRLDGHDLDGRRIVVRPARGTTQGHGLLDR